MTTRLIINSDDYGRSANVSRGIRHAHLHGIVTSTTCMMNMPTVVEDLQIALQETPNLGLGVHLVLTAGQPLLPADQVPSITRPDGAFLSLSALTARCSTFAIREVKAEWTAQIEKFVATTGKKPTHLDSHHHSSYFTPAMFQAMLELARDYACAIRLPVSQDEDGSLTGLPSELSVPLVEHAPKLLRQFQPRHADAFFASFYDETATKAYLLNIIASLKDGVYEIMCHPGYADPELIASSGYAVQRDREREIVTDPEVLAEIKKRKIELINFAQL
jgi:chitin disaccharide deacetylase